MAPDGYRAGPLTALTTVFSISTSYYDRYDTYGGGQHNLPAPPRSRGFNHITNPGRNMTAGPGQLPWPFEVCSVRASGKTGSWGRLFRIHAPIRRYRPRAPNTAALRLARLRKEKRK